MPETRRACYYIFNLLIMSAPEEDYSRNASCMLLHFQSVDFQNGVSKFNRAMLMNIGFVEALKIYDYQCFIFHDVDLIPETNKTY
jgi:hypothetical protein